MGSSLTIEPGWKSTVRHRDPDPTAHALSAFRVLKNGESRSYTATTFPRDPWQGCEHFIRTCFAVGFLCSSEDPDTYGLLDVLNINGDIVQDYGIPTAKAFAYIKRKLDLAVVPEERR